MFISWRKLIWQRHLSAHAEIITADLSDPAQAKNMYNTCKQNGWQVDVLINNAGFGGQGDFARERTMQQDMSMIAVNVEAPTRLCRLFLPDMITRHSTKTKRKDDRE